MCFHVQHDTDFGVYKGRCNTVNNKVGKCLYAPKRSDITCTACKAACAERSWCVAYDCGPGSGQNQCSIFSVGEERPRSGDFTDGACGEEEGKLVKGSGAEGYECGILGLAGDGTVSTADKAAADKAAAEKAAADKAAADKAAADKAAAEKVNPGINREYKHKTQDRKQHSISDVKNIVDEQRQTYEARTDASQRGISPLSQSPLLHRTQNRNKNTVTKLTRRHLHTHR